jgi:hypothetical protein
MILVFVHVSVGPYCVFCRLYCGSYIIFGAFSSSQVARYVSLVLLPLVFEVLMIVHLL